MLVIDMGRAISVGEEVWLEDRHTFIDTRGTFEPFLTHHASAGLRRLAINVQLPVGMDVTAYETVEDLRNGNSDSTLSRATIVLVDGAEYQNFSMQTTAIVAGLQYAIRWKW